MAKRKDQSQLGWKRKKWTTVVSPSTYGEIPVGETMALEPSDAIGRTVEVNLMHLTKNMKKQNVNIKFKVTELKDGKAATRSHEYVMQPSSIKRLVRAGRDRIDESFIIKTEDGVYARIKPLFLTYNKQTAATRTRVRRSAVSFIRKYAAQKSLEDLFKDIVDGKLQKELSIKMREFLRVRNSEIRAIEVVEDFSSVKQKKLEKRQERESKRVESEEQRLAKLAEEKAERNDIRAEELAKLSESAPASAVEETVEVVEEAKEVKEE